MTRTPAWARALLRLAAPPGHADEAIGDIEEAHRIYLRRHRPLGAWIRTAIDTVDMSAALVRTRIDLFGFYKGNGTVQDYKLGLRMLLKYPGLTIAGGLAIAIAIGIGAGWYDLSGDLFRPTLPVPNGDRIVEVEMRDSRASEEERRILHDFLIWRETARTLEHLGAYRSLERNLIRGDAAPEPVTVAETTASMFHAVPVPPLHGRPLLPSDEHPGAPSVVVLGYGAWHRWFGGRTDAIGQTLQLGRSAMTIVGVMPKGFAFPVNHEAWIPLQLSPSGYQPLEGPPIRVFGLVASNATQAAANVEIAALTDRVKTASPATHEHLSPRVLAHGGESPGDVTALEFAVRHLPIVFVLLVACANVGTLIYARTATREAEIAMRSALGATRSRIIGQLFVEALVLASFAAAIGLAIANFALKWGLTAFYSGGSMPFWVHPGLKPTTVIFAAGLTIIGAALLGILPALKATGRNAQMQLRNLGSGGSTLQFGTFWTTAMIAQVALAVICIPPAWGIGYESWRDREIRSTFPADRYLAARIDVDRDAAPTAAGEESEAAIAARVDRIYRQFEHRVEEEPGVVAVTFADRLPGMGVAVRRAEVEVAAGAPPREVPMLWTAAVGAHYFETFDIPILTGRDFHERERVSDGRTVLVNEAFVRRSFDGANPVGRRMRYASGDPNEPGPWFEIVGLVKDVGMTPTDLGEAPYVYHAASPATTQPLVMAVRVANDPAALAPRLRVVAAEIDAGLRLGEVATLDDLAWRQDLPAVIVAIAIGVIVVLGLFLSAAGIFSLMSVSVARRTKEIGLRAALGASTARLLVGIFSRALLLIGSGITAGNAILLLAVALHPEAELSAVWGALLGTSLVMLTVGALACVEPARRALGISPTDALKES